MNEDVYYSRHLHPRLMEALADSPAVLLHGPRQCGKTTLARLVGVEVKAGATVTAADFKGLRKLQEAAPKAFVAGTVLYDGDSVASFGDNLYAVPISCLWSAR